MHKNKAPASRTSPMVSSSTTTCATNTNTDMDLSQQTPRDHCADDVTCVSSLKEITLIETVTSFLEENGAADVDPTVLRNLAEALSKRIDDSSPGVLHDVTMENSYSSFEAARATLTGQGNHSPLVTQSRSVRDLEEQISTLSKENFNLKLRLYFMEESEMGSRTQQSDKQLSKQLLDAKIDIELLRKTINDKTKLLKEAACALAQHEDMQKQSDMKHQTIVEQLQQHIRHLECTAEETEAKLSRNAEVTRLEEAFLQCQEERTAAKEQIEKLELALNDRDDSLTACENKIQELAIKNAELVEEMEKHVITCNQTNESLELKQTELNSSLMENSCLTSKLSAVTKDLVRQNQYTRNSNKAIEAQSQTIRLLEQREESYHRLLNRLFEYEKIIDRQVSDLDSMRQENQFLKNMAGILQPFRSMQHLTVGQHLCNFGYKNLEGYDAPVVSSDSTMTRSDSCTSLRSNFSSISILCGSKEQMRSPICMPIMSLTQHGDRRRSSVTPKIPSIVLQPATPRTAFFNYSIPTVTGLRQFFFGWRNSPSKSS